jgi:glycosyltransferase involved in cell wall biosynthesis
MRQSLRALVVSYAFPPVGGAGVQRVLKLVKYLPTHGVTPVVLTVANPSVPVRDESLERDIPATTEIIRVRTLEPGYSAKRLAWNAAVAEGPDLRARVKRQLVTLGRQLLVPDPQVLWLPFAGFALGARLASKDRDDVVFISGPPFSQFLLAAIARLLPGTAVVLDYRDEWTTTQGVYEMGGSAGAADRLERAILRSAHAVTTATDAFRTELLARFDFLDPRRVHTVTNGYDPEDFPKRLPSPRADRFVLTYVGTVFRLTSARGLLTAVRLLHDREPGLAKLLEVRFIGRIVETEASYFEGTEAIGVQRLGYFEHEQALAELAQSHAVLCLLDDLPGASRIYPAKIFEIMYLRRPCLALAPNGVLARLVQDHALGDVIHPRDSEAIFVALSRMLHAFRTNAAGAFDDAATHPVDIDRFNRQTQAGEFARIFRAARDHARTRGSQSSRFEAAAFAK